MLDFLKPEQSIFQPPARHLYVLHCQRAYFDCSGAPWWRHAALAPTLPGFNTHGLDYTVFSSIHHCCMHGIYGTIPIIQMTLAHLTPHMLVICQGSMKTRFPYEKSSTRWGSTALCFIWMSSARCRKITTLDYVHSISAPLIQAGFRQPGT